MLTRLRKHALRSHNLVGWVSRPTIRHSHCLTLCFATILFGCTTAGCDDSRKPDGDDIVYFVQAARIGAKTWRLPREAKEYVQDVLTAYATLEAASAAATVWPLDSPNWQDAAALDALIKTQYEFASREASAKRTSQLTAFVAALNAAPPADNSENLPSRVLAALTFGTVSDPAELVPPASPLSAQFAALVEDARAHLTQADKARPGLHYADKTIEADLQGRHGQITEKRDSAASSRKARLESLRDTHALKAKEMEKAMQSLGATYHGRGALEYRRAKVRRDCHDEYVRYANREIAAINASVAASSKPH